MATRFAAAPLVGTMVVAIATAQWAQVENAAGLFGLAETLYVVIFVWLGIAGPGAISVDHWFGSAWTRRRRMPAAAATC